MILRVAVLALVALAVLGLGFVVWVRMAPDTAERWQADPAGVTRTGQPNDWLLADREDADGPAVSLPGSPEAVLSRLDAIVAAEPRTSVLTDTAGERTYVQRSAWLRFPDYVSVTATGGEGGVTLSVYSRSRYGYSDLGVNRDRVGRWLAALRSEDAPHSGE